jgi:dihydroflavonol-4-reductase
LKALVLGATGFIGGHIARAALENGWQVRGLRRNPLSTGHLDEETIEWFNGDLSHPETLENAMEGIDILFHAAAYYPKAGNPQKVSSQITYANNEISNVIKSAKNSGIKRLIYTSTLTTIGHPPKEENRLADERDFYLPGSLRKSAYYESKSMMENVVLNSCSANFDALALNPTAVLGPGDVSEF